MEDGEPLAEKWTSRKPSKQVSNASAKRNEVQEDVFPEVKRGFFLLRVIYRTSGLFDTPINPSTARPELGLTAVSIGWHADGGTETGDVGSCAANN